MKQETIDRIRKFVKDREWAQFHTEENLAKSIAIEASELLECFQWSSEYDEQHVKEELADVIIYCQDLLDRMHLDVDEIVNMKMDMNEKKYPVEKACGNAKKYTELQECIYFQMQMVYTMHFGILDYQESKMKKLVNGILGLFLMISSILTPIHAEESFSDFEDELFQEMMSEDYTTLHFSLRDYQKYGIEKPDVNIGDASWDDYEDSVEDCDEYLKKLQSFDYDSLSETEQKDYRTIAFYLERNKELNSYPYFDWAFNSAEGVIDNLLTTFTEFVFQEKEDIDDYLATLASVPAYLDQCLENTKKQAAKGYFLTDAMLKATEDAIEKFVDKKDDNELIKIFDENIDAFDGLSAEEKEAYKKKNQEIVLNAYIPSYEKVAEELQKLKGSRKADYNVSSLDGGSEYYAALARYKTSIDADVETILDICTQYIEKSVDELYDIMQNHSEVTEETLDFDSAEDVLSYLEGHLDAFPVLDKVYYNVQYLDPSVANDSIVAYYLSPPVDDMRDNVIKINGNNVSDVIDLYTTLAHEGFPGHLYQTNYYIQQQPSLLRTQLTMMGYQEGWGMFAEGQALHVSGLSEYASEYQKINIELNYVLSAAVDLGANGLGWSTKDVSKYLDRLDLNGSIAKDLYDFATLQPGTILPYGVGIAMFELLENKAKNALGNDFDQKAFNEVLLNDGNRPFEVVEEDVNAYCGIDENDENNIISHRSNNKETPVKDDVNWLLYGACGCGIIVIGAMGVILYVKSRKDDPFQS